MGNKNSFAFRLIAVILTLCVAAGMFAVVSFADDGVLGPVDPASAQGEYTVPDGTTALADYAFKDCTGLTGIVIPASVKKIGAGAFSGCTNLKNVVFKGSLDAVGIKAFNDTPWYQNYPTDFIFASSPTGFNLLIGYKGTDTEVEIPVSTSAIGAGAFFENTDITSVRIPLRTETIGDYAFYGCTNLSSITVKGAIDNCGYMAFNGTKWLEDYAGDYIVFGTLLVKYNGDDDLVLLPNTITKIASYAFLDCKETTTVRIPSSVKEIGPNAFYMFNDNGNAKYAEIYCWKNTYAEEYAKANNLPIASYMCLPGDVNKDDNVFANDAREILRYAAKIERNFDEASFIAGDIDGDGKIAAVDARQTLRMAAKIAGFTPEELLLKPNTPFEILMAYTEAVRLAYIKEAGYNLKGYQEITKVDLGPSWVRTVLNNPFKTELTKEKKAKTEKLSSDTVEALEKLYLCNLTNDSIIKSAKCVLSESDKYYITIALNDEIDVEGTDSLTSCIFPVVDRETMNKTLDEKESIWYHNKNTDLNYRITYTDSTLKATVDVESGNIEDIEMKMGYKFDVWGQIILTKISNRSYGSNELSIIGADGKKIVDTVDSQYKVGTAWRTDTVKYSAFNYVNPDIPTTTEAPATLPEDVSVDGDVTVPTTAAPKANNFLDSIGDVLKNAFGSIMGG